MRHFLAVLSFGFLITTCALADTIVGQPADSGSGNCFPFGCPYNAEYQQVYTSSAFSGPITITGLEFFNTQANEGSTSLPTGNYTIDLSTTSADWNSLSSNFSSNVGPDNTQVFSGSISQAWTFGDTLDIAFSTPFTYNPANGNLLMDVVGSGVSTPGGNTYFDVNSSDSTLGRVYCPGGVACSPTGTTANDYGLVTDFVSSTAPVPEPSAVPFAAAFAGLMIVIRKRLWAK